MKRFLLFTFDSYYPDGGWRDFAGDFGTVGDALKIALQTPPQRAAQGLCSHEWYQIVDSLTGVVVETNLPICDQS